MRLFESAIIICAAAISCVSCSKDKYVAPDYKQLSYNYGIEYGNYMRLMQESFNGQLDIDQTIKAIKDVLDGKCEISADEAKAEINDFINITIPAYNKHNAENFLSTIEAKGGFRKTESGLLYKIRKPGRDEHPTYTSTARICFKCTLTDGKTVLDQTGNSKSDARELNLAQIMPGLSEGIQLIGKNGRIEIWVPYSLAYGPDGDSDAGIGPYENLYYDIRLMDFE